MDLPFEVPEGLSLELDVSPAEWIDDALLAPRQPGDGVLVGEILPTGFEAYARILHPAIRRVGDRYEPISWAELAHERGKIIHPEVQLKAVLGDEFRDGPPWGELPEEGSLPEDLRDPLVAILRSFTGTANRCWFCIWEGYGLWFGGSPFVLMPRARMRAWLKRRAMERDARRRAGQERKALEKIPKVDMMVQGPERIPQRSYFLFSGSVDAVPGLKIGGISSQSPNYWWPDDRAWIVASELDAPSTYVGGSDRLVQAILANGDLEAVRSNPRHRFDWLGDRINAPYRS